MSTTQKIWRYVFSPVFALLFGVQVAQADSVGQVQTTKYFAPETVAMIKQRVLDVANGVPGATLGFKTGDTVSYIIQFTPIANSANIGAGGYITDYIPAGTQVTNAAFVQPDGFGGFYQTSPPAPALMANGFGLGGAGAYTATWTSDAYTISTCSAAGRTLANCTGNLAQLYADTGIFYSTDSRTQVFPYPSTDGRVRQWGATTGGNGYYVNSTRNTQLVPIMGGTTGVTLPSTHNLWDAAMTDAFGSNVLPTNTPNSGTAKLDSNGAGLPPFNAGSPVAGPDTGYQLDYTGNVGPWQRVSYPGSMVGSNAFSATNPAVAAGTTAVLATSTFSGASFPLPPSTNAVRWAAGRLVVGTQNYVKISLLLTTTPPSAGLVNNSEVFGGDASPESNVGGPGNRDSAWVYHVPSVASNVSTLYTLKEVICVYDATGTCVTNNGANLPTTGTPATVGPKVRYRIAYINTNNGTQHNVVICDQLPTTTPAITFATGVSQISASPYIGVPTSPAAPSCGFGAGGTTFSYPTIPVMAGGAAGVIEYDVQFPILTAGTSISNTTKAVSTEIPAGVTSVAPSNVVASLAADLRIVKSNSLSAANKGDSVTYTITVTNAGSSAASITTLVDILPGVATAVPANQIPSRFNYVATGTATINGSPVSGVTNTVTPPVAPGMTNSEIITWTFPSGTTIPGGGQLVVSFTATVGNNTINNFMAYGTAYSNTATINCSANCVTTPATATTKSTGATAPVTLTIPNLQITKTIDCVFSGATCIAGSYAVSSSIPPSAKLRYKIAYANPAASAQTVTLSDTLPASTTSAGNLYVASGPDIRPSTPVLSVNPAAAGAARGVDASLTAIAPSTVINFTSASLAGGSSGILYMDVQTNVAATVTVTNTSSIQSAERLTSGGAAVTSVVNATASALSIIKTSNIATAVPGDNVIYTITVTNPTGGAVILTNVVDVLPKPLPNTAGRTILCGTSVPTCLATTTLTINGVAAAAPTLAQTAATATVGQINTWTLAGASAARTLNAGQTMVLTFTATFSPTVLRDNIYSNTARINYTGGSSETGLTAPVAVPYNSLNISKAVVTPVSASIAPNNPVTYAVTVTNTGTTPAPVTSVVDSLPAATVGTISYTSTTSVLVNGVAQTGVAGVPVGAQYTNPNPAAAAPNVQQVITWTFPAAGTAVINPGQAMVITFVVQYGAIPAGLSYYNEVLVNYTGGPTASTSEQNLAPVNVSVISKITKTIDCIYQPTCVAGSYVDGTPIPVNAKLGYKIVYENLSALAVNNVTITDILPTQTAANSISNLIVNGTPTAAPPSAGGGATATLLTGGTLAASATGTITFDVQTTATVGAGVTNTGKMTSTQDPVGVTSFAIAATDGANLSVSKTITSSTSSTIAQGGVVSYTITVSNNGSSSATLNTLVDTLPGVAATAPGTTSRFTYTATGVINLNGLTITPTYTAVVTPPAAPATTNKEVVTWTFTGGVVIPAGQTLTLTFTATVGTVVPKGTTAPGATYYNDIAANYSGGLFPSASATNQAAVLVPFNTLTMAKTIDCVYDTQAIPVCQPHTAGNPVPPNAKLRYKLLYANTSPLAQTVTIKDSLPASTTAAGNLYVGSGPEIRPSIPAISQNSAAAGAARGGDVALTAIASGSTVAMTAVSLPGNGSGILYVDVQTNVVAGVAVSNCASISTVAADTCATLGVVSSTATATAQNVAVLSISKTTSTPNVIPGGTATYTITVTNTGTAATQTLAVYDFLPYSSGVLDTTKRLAYSSTTGFTGGLPVVTPTTSVAPTVAPYSSNVNQQQIKWDFGAFALAAGASATITFNATVGSAMPAVSYYNSVRFEQTSASTGFNGNSDNQALITVNNPTPSLMFMKTVAIISDPANGSTNPKFIPGAVAQYTLSAINSGTGSVDDNTTLITDPVPANTALFVSDIGGTPVGPISFTQGTSSSTLIYTPATDVSFSNDNGTTWTYVPVAGTDGCDPLVTHMRLNPKGTFVGNPTPPSPSFNFNFRVCVK